MHHILKKILRSLIVIVLLSILLSSCQLASFGNPPKISSTPDQGFLVPTVASGTAANPTVQNTLTPFPTSPPLAHPLENKLKDRVGLGISSPADPTLWAARLGAGWYLDWSVKDIPSTNVPERWQMIRLAMKTGVWTSSPTQDKIASLARKNPGFVWIIGNEPDVIWQDSLTAENYAQAYHDLYTLLKQSDPSARVAVAGISQATDLRLAYLDQVISEYRRRYGVSLPADWWTVHGFILREEKGSWGVDIPPGFDQKTGTLYEVTDHNRLDLFTQQLTAFRKWMAGNGYQDVPLALTEYGILMPPDLGFSPEASAKYLQQTFLWLQSARDDQIGFPGDDKHLVQRWAWFSLSDSLYPASDLADLKQNQLTVIGKAFQELTQSNQ